MSLAHLRETQAQSNRTSPTAPRRVAAAPAGLCGASSEPVYRTMDEAAASGLEICDTCIVLFRRQGKAH
jgi:hypothetical protein